MQALLLQPAGGGDLASLGELPERLFGERQQAG